MKVTPVHAQLGIASLMGLASLVLVVTTLIPQVQQVRQYQHQEQASVNTAELPALKALPLLSRNNPGQLERVVFAPLKTAAAATHIRVNKIEGSVFQAEPMGSLPPVIQKIPLKLSATGSYSELAAFQSKLLTLFPAVALREMHYELKPDAVLRPGTSPKVEATWVFDLIIKLS